MQSEELVGKHLNAEDRRRRFDPKSKYGGHGGSSLVKARPRSSVHVDGFDDIYLKIKRPTDEDGNVLVSKLDQELQTLLPTGDDGKVLPGGRLFQLPDILEAQCVTKSTQREKRCPDVIVTTYAVQGTAWMALNEEERRKLEQRRKVRLSLARADGHHVFCSFRDRPLEKIAQPSLLDSHARLTASAQCGCCDPRNARVLEESALSCWCSPTESDAHLEVDLGATCQVTYVSTQGRFPPTYPRREGGMRVVVEESVDFNNWVTSYELSCRLASGRDWIAIGELKGNDDMTTEVAHEMARILKSGLQCRYLRFRPLTYHRRPAMRVGVYGERLEGRHCPKEVSHDANVIEYSIYRVKENANLRWAPVGCAACRYGCAKCSKSRGTCKVIDDTATMRRKRLRQGALEELRKLTVEVDFDVHEPEAAAQPNVILGAAGTDAAVEPCPRLLQRMRSLSDPDLMVRTPSSLANSVVLVDDLEFVANLDEGGWLVV